MVAAADGAVLQRRLVGRPGSGLWVFFLFFIFEKWHHRRFQKMTSPPAPLITAAFEGMVLKLAVMG